MKKSVFEKKLYVVFFAVVCNLLWGSAYPGIKIGYELFSVTDNTAQKLLFAGIRFAAAGIMVLIVSVPILKKPPIPNKRALPLIGLTALVYTFAEYVFFYIGLSNTTGTNGSIFNSTSTFMAVILAHFFYKDDKLTAKKLIGTLLGFLGVLTATLSGGKFSFAFNGEGFIMLAALCFVVGSMISKRATAYADSMTVTGYNLLFGGIFLVLSGFLPGGRLGGGGFAGTLVLLYLAFLSACAFTLWTMLLKYNPVGKISVFNFIIPISGTLLSAIFLGENIMKWQYLVSLALVCIGIITVNHSASDGH